MAKDDVKYPQITVQLMGEDGNAFSIIGKMKAELKRNGVPPEKVKEFFGEATGSDSYDDLLMTCMRWVNVR
jgi:hypothetical protein